MMDESKLNIEILKILFKVFRGCKFETPIPDDTVEIIKEYINSRQITVQLNVKEVSLKKTKHFEIGWNQDELLTDLVSTSVKLFEPHVEDFKKAHIETKNKWFLDENKYSIGKYGEFNSQVGVITEIVLNQEKYLPGFQYFYEFELSKHNEGHLLFVSEVGVLAVVGVTNSLKKKKDTKDHIMKLKNSADERFGNMFVAIIGLYATSKNDEIGLSPVDPFDGKIAKKVKGIVEDEHEASNTDISLDTDSEEDDDNPTLQDIQEYQESSFWSFFKSIIKFILFFLIFDLIFNIYSKEKEAQVTQA
jgi:hypothetical protein